ncbi:MAG TPA: alpha/beta fold hydrolase [Candidatus Limnocylindria bacterium]|nr:alpha/beta fold hydrolase [Candidatus Limnocylindria bacterium]
MKRIGGMRAGALALALGCLAACAAPIRVERVSPRQAYREATDDVLRGGRPSEITRNVLRRRSLLDVFEHDPDAALGMLHADAVGETGGRRELFALAELSFLRAEQTRRQDRYLAAAVYAWAFLFPHDRSELPTRFDPRARLMCDVYNQAVAAAVADEGRLVLRGGELPLPFGTLEVAFDPSELDWDGRRLTDFVSTADLRVHGLRNRYRLAGLGAPAAAHVTKVAHEPADLLGPAGRVPVTVLLRLDGVRDVLAEPRIPARLEIHVASEREWTEVAGETVPLETELTSTLATSLAESRFWKLELRRFFGRLSGLPLPPSLVASAPHRGGRIPVVFVHGTASSPGRWADMVNDLWSERFFREHYEAWVFSYDTGNPVAYSARALRRALRGAVQSIDPERRDSCLRRMVVVGHSQGGLLAKMTAIDTGDRLWNGIASRPLAELRLREKERRLLEEIMFLEPLPFVGRVIFIATPHGGSYQALRSVSGFIAGFVSIPKQMLELSRDVVTLNPDALRAHLWRDGVPTSINDMTPGSPFQRALQSIPVVPEVPAHSIIALDGDEPFEIGGDGVVKCMSARMSGVESELVVRSGHSTQSHPETIQEVNRILRLHVARLAEQGLACGRPSEPQGS